MYVCISGTKVGIVLWFQDDDYPVDLLYKSEVRAS